MGLDFPYEFVLIQSFLVKLQTECETEAFFFQIISFTIQVTMTSLENVIGSKKIHLGTNSAHTPSRIQRIYLNTDRQLLLKQTLMSWSAILAEPCISLTFGPKTSIKGEGDSRIKGI